MSIRNPPEGKDPRRVGLTTLLPRNVVALASHNRIDLITSHDIEQDGKSEGVNDEREGTPKKVIVV
jgi:hypothetical protein